MLTAEKQSGDQETEKKKLLKCWFICLSVGGLKEYHAVSLHSRTLIDISLAHKSVIPLHSLSP